MDYDDDIDQNEGETLSFVTDGDGRRLDVWLADRSGLSRSRVQSLIGDGRVELDGVRRDEDFFAEGAGFSATDIKGDYLEDTPVYEPDSYSEEGGDDSWN